MAIAEKGINKLSPKQEETVEVIAKLTLKNNYPPTLDEIAAVMGITKGTLQYHMTALKKKSVVDWKPAAARSLQIVDSYYVNKYLRNNSRKTRPNSEFKVEENVSTHKIPILGKIAAGAPLDVCTETDEFLELDSYFPGGCYALRVKGESMIDAYISHGDLVLIEPRQTAYNGEIVVALLDDESATLKRFFREDDGSVRLQPENPTMKPIMVSSKRDLKIQGIVKGVIRKV